jgi:hypothetical protein
MGFIQRKKEQQNQVQSPEPLPVIRTSPQPQNQPIPVVSTVPSKNLREEWKVVPELPVQPIREITREDGTVLHLITIDEALNLLLNE